MRECRQCGFPRKFATYFDWREDGTIISTDRSGTRAQIAFLNAGEFESIFNDLSHTIGLNVDPFLVRAYKGIGKAIFSHTPVRHVAALPNNRLFRPQFLARALLMMTAADVATLGTGRVSLDRFTPGRSAVVRFRYPCLHPLLAGSAAAMYESVEGITDSQVDFELDAGDLVVRLRPASEPTFSAEFEDRLYYEEAVPVEGPVRYSRCRECGAPALAGLTFKWDVKRGVIKNRLSGEREVVVAVQAVNAILRELEIEMGEGIPGIIYGHQKALTRERLEQRGGHDGERFWDEYLADMALRGMGYPLSIARTPSSVSVDIANAYNLVLYAAKTAAAFEVTSGQASEIEWRKRQGNLGAFKISSVAGPSE
jgi:hypothetical protein